MKKLSLSLGCAVLTVAVWLSGQTAAAAIFPAQGDDTMSSMGVFRVVVAPAFRPLLAPAPPTYTSGYPGYRSADGRLTSPALLDSATTVGRSAPHNRVLAGSVPVGLPSMGNLGYADYPAIPALFGTAPAPTREILTQIRSFALASSREKCPPDPRVPTVPLDWVMVKAGPNQGVVLKSIGMVQENVPNGAADPDFPARSFFDIFVEVSLPSVPGTVSSAVFPALGATLYNDSPLIITNLNLSSLPPNVVYIHGETTAVPLKFKDNNPPYWNAGDVFGYLVLAGHGTQTDCTSESAFLDAVLGPIGTSRPEMPVEWPFPNPLCPPTNSTYNSVRDVDTVNFSFLRARNFSHTNLINPIIPPPLLNGSATYNAPNTLVRLEMSSDGGNSWVPTQANGQVVVTITNTTGTGNTSFFDTEMLQLNLSGISPSPFRIRESPTKQSLGKHTLQPSPPDFLVSSFFDVFLELSTDGGVNWIPADRSIRVYLTPPATNSGIPVVVSCSSNLTVTATGPDGALVTYSSSASGGCTPPVVNCNPPSGSTFPVGTTPVTCTASDTCGNTNTCNFTVTVNPPVGDPCLEPDNGTGTVTLPPAGCQYLSPDEVHMIIDGLPPGTTIELAAIHKNFICGSAGGGPSVCSFNSSDCREAGGPLGGEKECASSTLELTLTGTGALAGFQRQLNLPVGFETHVGPRTLGQPVQSFDTDMFRLQGQLPPGDPDFDLLRITAGTDFGLPSPGHTTLTQLPGGNWAVDSFFDITYRIDFVGKPGGHVGGMSGSTTGTIRMVAVRPSNPPITLTCSTNITVTATSAAGAVVNYFSSASGGCAPVTVNCNPPSGSTFPIGTTTVTCTASDGCGQTADCSFTVTVRPPEHFNPSNSLPPTNTVYISPALWHVLYANGIIIRDVRHRGFTQNQPPPPLGATQTHTFGSEVDFEVSQDNGATFQPGSGTANVTVRVTHTQDTTDRSFFDTEMLQLDLNGPGFMVRESPTLASTGHTTVRPVPGGYMISSFFDVFTELSVDNGQTWLPAQQPAHVELRNDPRKVPSTTTPSTLLPPPNGSYISPAQWHALFAQGIIIRDVRHKFFTDSMPPPAGGNSTHSFNSSLDLQLSIDGGNTFQAIRASTPVQVTVASVGSGASGMFDTEMLSLSISVPGTAVMIRESPTEPSRGATQIDAQPNGTYRISSFFDIFTELSLDGGQTWSGPTNGPVRVQLTPQANEQPTSSPNLPVTNAPYVSPQQWHALYANGIIITNVIHDRFTQTQPPPPPGGSQIENFGSTVSGQVSLNGGQTFTPFSIPATSTVQVNSRAEQDTSSTRFFDTEMLALNLSGGSFMVRESPSKASLGRTSVRTTPDGYRISSFFDIFTEISLDGGQNWSPSTTPPATMSPRLPPKKRFFPNPNLPATNSQYISPRQWHALYANGIIISNVTHRRFLANFPPPPPRSTNIHNFDSQVNFLLKTPGQPQFVPMTANANCQVSVGSSGLQSSEKVFQTEMLALNLSGGSLPAGVMIRESPTRRSSGETRYASASGGYRVNSFFDIFTELSLDGGQTWSASDSPGYMELHIDPGVPPTTIVQPRIQAGNPTFTVQSQLGLRYLLQYKNSVEDPTWTTLSITPGTGQPMTLTDIPTPPNAKRFYRVEVAEDDNY